jgi:hypothetical protein
VLARLLVLGTGCGASQPRGLRDGSWYGKLTSISVMHRTLAFAPACRLNELRRWIPVRKRERPPTTLALASRTQIDVYYRPHGAAGAGHGQSADLRRFVDVVLGPASSAFPPGWFVAVRDHHVVSISEDSGISSSGKADQLRNACIWSRATRLFVSR